MSNAMRDKWDARYREADAAAAQPVEVLTEYAHLLPREGDALELACGLGANARWLAHRGLRVAAWDLSAEAIAKLRAQAEREGVAVDARVRDLATMPIPESRFDVVVVSRFLERELAPAIAAALRPGGLLFYQTFIRERVTSRGPDDEAFRLGPNELLRLFPDLRVVVYREEARFGDTGRGLRDEALLIAARPA